MKRRWHEERERAEALADAFAEQRGLLARAERDFVKHDGAGEWSVAYRLHAEPGWVWDPAHVLVIVDTRRGVACFLGETIEPDD